MKSRFLDPAKLEAREAIDHYDQLTPELGHRFIASLHAAVRLLEEYPESSPVIAKDVRKKVLLEFPYTLFYRITDIEVLILAVAHQGRRPGYWIKRMGTGGGV
jgi:plasmid stabilization system protein ParE